MKVSPQDLKIKKFGKPTFTSPYRARYRDLPGSKFHFVSDAEKALFDVCLPSKPSGGLRTENLPLLELAGPRSNIYFNPKECKAAIVACGGLCPGINDVIRSIVMTLHYGYGIKKVVGIPYGYQGFIGRYGHKPHLLTPERVSDIHKVGGSILATSRGNQSSAEIVRYLVGNKINLLFTIGGDGTLRGALAIAKEINKQKRKISVVGIPKTIDNDILYMDQSFGFETAFSEAVRSITSAHTEAHGAPNGIGLVKMMGRHSGFIACHSALAMNDVNFVFIPEVPFELTGKNGFFQALRKRLQKRKHAVIAVAEGAGQNLIEAHDLGTDASGNPRLKDIGIFMKEKILEYFKSIQMPVNLKYIDPSYMIRSVPASPQDSLYCLRLGQHAAHAAMSGKTCVVIGRRNNAYVHLPMELISKGRKQVDPSGELWYSVLSATGQPSDFSS
ncbi:ATP-dependent 6-phosphofructokinase [Omnitrophica bacterium]|nr:ATP-dependent 6-phosphofructokinase [Candidatus Omnitrophota bacterium]